MKQVEKTVNAERMLTVARESHPIYQFIPGKGSYLQRLMKAEEKVSSKQQVTLGRKPHPFDMKSTLRFVTANVHHSTCLQTKRNSHVGLGFKNKETAKVLNKLCFRGYAQDMMNDISDDYWSIANGYMEVVRGLVDQQAPKGLFHQPGAEVHLVIEDELYNAHYEVNSRTEGGPQRICAIFGDLEDFRSRSTDTAKKRRGRPSMSLRLAKKTTELIPFRRSTNLSRWYGFPDWMAAVAPIEVVQMLTQHTFDFFLNRGVPEFMLFLLGKKIGEEEWTRLEDAMKSNIGLGNSRKSLALNISDPGVEVILHKLALDGKADGVFGEYSDTLAMQIVSAHRVPPLLAGILIPGKLGATNELPNALMSFQALVIGQAQNDFSTILAASLGNKELNGGLELNEESFEWKKITDEIDLGMADTVGRMRQTVPEAKAEGRDLAAGVKKQVG